MSAELLAHPLKYVPSTPLNPLFIPAYPSLLISNTLSTLSALLSSPHTLLLCYHSSLSRLFYSSPSPTDRTHPAILHTLRATLTLLCRLAPRHVPHTAYLRSRYPSISSSILPNPGYPFFTPHLLLRTLLVVPHM